MIFFCQIKTNILLRSKLLEGCILQTQKMQSAEAARKTLQRILFIWIVHIDPTHAIPSERTLDRVFAQLPQIPGIQVTKKDKFKYYGFFGDVSHSIASEPSEADPDLDDEEKEWQAVDAELQAQKVERAKEMLKKVLLPKLEEIRRKMKEELNN